MIDRRRLLIAVIGVVLVAILFFMLIFKPKLSEVSDVRQQVEASEQEEQTLRARINTLKGFQANQVELRAKQERIATLLPSDPNLPDFIRLLQTAATQAGIDLQSIAPSLPSPLENATGVNTITVTIVAEGGFHRIDDFLARLEQLRRIVLVTSISLSPSVDELSGLTTLNSTFSLKMFEVEKDATLGTATGSTTTSSSATTSPSPSPSPSPGVS